MAYWRWNAGLSSAEIREQVLLALLERDNSRAAGPSCSLVPSERGSAPLWSAERLKGHQPTGDDRAL
jgi:hypothetical protein